jgi:hypothetical protein
MKRDLLPKIVAATFLFAAFCQKMNGDVHVWKMKNVDVTTQVNDLNRQGDSLSVHGLSMLVPLDWSFQGMATIPPKLDCSLTVGRFNLAALSPDKSSGLEVVALGTTFWSDNRAVLQQVEQQNRRSYSATNCSVEQPFRLADSLGTQVSKVIPDGHLEGSVQAVPGLSERLAAEVEQASRQLGGGSHLSAEAARVRVKGSIRGVPVEAWLVVLHTIRFDPAPGGGMNQLSDIPLFALMYAAPGHLDAQEKMFSAMLDSIQVDPQWTQYVAQFTQQLVQIRQRGMNQVSQIYANMASDNARAAAQRQQIRQDSQDYSSKVYSNVAQSRAVAMDHSSQQFALHMGDQAIYTDPASGHRVQMSNQYAHAWASSTGNTNEYILSDSPSFNPNGQVGSGSWTQMQQEH